MSSAFAPPEPSDLIPIDTVPLSTVAQSVSWNCGSAAYAVKSLERLGFDRLVNARVDRAGDISPDPHGDAASGEAFSTIFADCVMPADLARALKADPIDESAVVVVADRLADQSRFLTCVADAFQSVKSPGAQFLEVAQEPESQGQEFEKPNVLASRRLTGRRLAILGAGSALGLAFGVLVGSVGVNSSVNAAQTPAAPGLGTESASAQGSPSAQPGGLMLDRSAAVPDTDWVAILTHLDAQRAQAIAAGDAVALEQVDAADSQALRSDQQVIEGLLEKGVKPQWYSQTITSVREAKSLPQTEPIRKGARVSLEVTDTRAAYDLVDAKSRRLVAHVPARPSRTWNVTLLADAQGLFRVSSVTTTS